MIEQTAEVTDVATDFARVRVLRETTCGSCQAQKGCGTHALSKVLGQKFSELTVLNHVDAKIGDVVKIGLSEQVLLKSAFFVYLFPLAMLFVGAISVKIMILWFALDVGQWAIIMGGLVGIVYAFARIKSVMKNRIQDDRYQPVILSKEPPKEFSLRAEGKSVNFVEG